MKNRLFHNFQVKLMLLFALFALVPLVAVGVLAIRTAEDLILNMASNQVEQVANDKGALLERWISERKADVTVVAGTSILQSNQPAAIMAYLELIRQQYRVYSDLTVVSGDGRVICSTALGKTAPEAAGWLAVAREGHIHISDIGFNAERNESYFRIAAPVRDDVGRVKRIVCATVGTNAILSALLRVSLGETGECYLVNREGLFLAHKEPRRILKENIAQSESFRNIFSARNRGVTYVDYRGIEVIGASARVGGTDWALVVEQDRDEAFHSADVLRRYIYLIVVLSICGALISAWMVARYVAGPVRRLSEAADCLAAGQYEGLALSTRRKDEIGVLYTAFADMARRLHDRQHRLETRMELTEAELKETDGKLRATEEAAARSQQLASLGRLAAGVAHEIRTPLTSLKLFLESVESDIAVSVEYEEDFQVAMKQIRRMEATINRFLDFARPQEPVFQSLKVGELVEDTLTVAGPRARQQETEVLVSVPVGLPELRGDRRQLGEVLINLLVNALEATGEGGEVTIAAGLERTGGEREGRTRVRLDVADTGHGIGKANLARVFDPFFTTKATGTGLGLAIASRTVQRHGGEMQVADRDGSGAVFSVFLPVPAGGNEGH